MLFVELEIYVQVDNGSINTKTDAMMEYIVKITTFPSSCDYEYGIIHVFRDDNGIDIGFQFISPNGNKIWIPLGEMNKEPGSGERKLIWIEKDKILSIEPSIGIGNTEHFFITNNKIC